MRAKTPAWVGITYLIYVSLSLIVILGGAGYAVFVLGHSGWWIVAAILILGLGYSPWRWHCICTGVEVPYSKEFERQTE